MMHLTVQRARAVRAVALVVAMLLVVTGTAGVLAYTVNPSNTLPWGGPDCQAQGQSAIGTYESGSASTYTYSGACGYAFHVHAYFWGSDYQYHYMEDTWSPYAIVFFGYWTNSIYGYHAYPSDVTPYHETHAY